MESVATALEHFQRDSRFRLFFRLFSTEFASMQVYDPLQRLLELDARHNELLDRLEALDREVTIVLAEWTTSRPLITVSGDPNIRLVRDDEMVTGAIGTPETVPLDREDKPFDPATTLIVERVITRQVA